MMYKQTGDESGWKVNMQKQKNKVTDKNKELNWD